MLYKRKKLSGNFEMLRSHEKEIVYKEDRKEIKKGLVLTCKMMKRCWPSVMSGKIWTCLKCNALCVQFTWKWGGTLCEHSVVGTTSGNFFGIFDQMEFFCFVFLFCFFLLARRKFEASGNYILGQVEILGEKWEEYRF